MVDWLKKAQRGYDNWAAKPHNAKWVKRIDGTPIPNDLVVCIGQEFALPTPEAEPVAWEIYTPGCGSINSMTTVTRHKRIMEQAMADGADITPLFYGNPSPPITEAEVARKGRALLDAYDSWDMGPSDADKIVRARDDLRKALAGRVEPVVAEAEVEAAQEVLAKYVEDRAAIKAALTAALKARGQG